MATATKREMVNRIRRELRYYRALLRDPRTPRTARWLIGAGIGYLLMPFDVVPDFIPIIGQLDDVIVVSICVGIGMLFVPASVKRDVRLRTRPVRSLNAPPHSPILCETQALPSCFGVRVTAIGTRSNAYNEEILSALLRLVFEERVVVIDRSIAIEVFEPIRRVLGEQLPKTRRLDRITEHRNATLDLHNVEVESREAELHFIDMLAAYEALPWRYKKRIDGLKVCHRAPSETMIHQAAGNEDQRISRAVHPLAPNHPVTNRRLLSPELEGCRIVGMPDESGSKLLEELGNHARQSRFLYEHRDLSNDIVVWDATTTLNQTCCDASASSLGAARPVRRAGRSHELHSAYRVVLSPERSTSPSVASAPIH
jgi:uncharacterized membrane protein YkvA (DUF1232 family)